MLPAVGAREERIAEILKAVAHPLRLGIIGVLCKGERHVNAIAEQLGVAQPLVSQALRILRMRGLVTATRRGGFARYRLQEKALRDLMRCMERCAA